MTDDTEECARRSGQHIIALVDALNAESDGAVVMTSLTALVVFECERFGITLDQFIGSLQPMKTNRDAYLRRRRKGGKPS